MPHSPIVLGIVNLDEPVQPSAQHALLAVLALSPTQTHDCLLMVTECLDAILGTRILRLSLVPINARIGGTRRRTRARTEQIPHSDDRSARRYSHRSLFSDDHVLDWFTMPAKPDFPSSFAYPGVPQPDSTIVASREHQRR